MYNKAMYECKNCGGELRFEISDQSLHCTHCGGVFDPDQYDRELFAQQATYDLNIYECPNCGGEIASTYLSAVETCPYCGRQIMAKEMRGSADMPQEIIPFKIDKETCKRLYREHMRRHLFAPSKLKNDAFLDRFRPVYVPYWSYDVDFAKKPRIPVSKSYRKGDYVYTDHFTISGDLTAATENILYDASSRLSDQIGRYVMPFKSEDRRRFNPSYLFGYFADRTDVPPELYEGDAVTDATGTILKGIKNVLPAERISTEGTERSNQTSVGAHTRGARCIMLPMWFLTWRESDHVAYAVINGETGKVFSDMPISRGKFLISAAVTGAALFGLLLLLPTMSVYMAMLFASFLGVVALWAYSRGADEIQRERNHEDDKGYLYNLRSSIPIGKNRKKKKQKKKSPKSASQVILSVFFYIYMACVAVSLIRIFFGGIGSRRGMRTVGYVILMIAAAIFLFSTWTSKENAPENRFWFRDIAGTVIAIPAAFIIHLVNPAHDLWYYAMMFIVAAGVFWTLYSLLRQYSDLATHPEPHFFRGEKPGSGNPGNPNYAGGPNGNAGGPNGNAGGPNGNAGGPNAGAPGQRGGVSG